MAKFTSNWDTLTPAQQTQWRKDVVKSMGRMSLDIFTRIVDRRFAIWFLETHGQALIDEFGIFWPLSVSTGGLEVKAFIGFVDKLMEYNERRAAKNAAKVRADAPQRPRRSQLRHRSIHRTLQVTRDPFDDVPPLTY